MEKTCKEYLRRGQIPHGSNDYTKFLALVKDAAWKKIIEDIPGLNDLFKNDDSNLFNSFYLWVSKNNIAYDWKIYLYCRVFLEQEFIPDPKLTFSILSKAASDWVLSDVSENRYLLLFDKTLRDQFLLIEKKNKFSDSLKLNMAMLKNASRIQSDILDTNIVCFSALKYLSELHTNLIDSIEMLGLNNG